MESLKSIKNNDVNDIVTGGETSRWNSKEFEFFDSNYDNKLINIELTIEYINKETYFWNVYLFIKRVKDLIIIKDFIIRENLWICLRDMTLK